MRLLYLVRHASPTVRPDAPSREWALSERGVEEAHALAASASGWGLRALYASSELKAQSTALIMGDALGLMVNVADAFDELRIPGWIGNADEFNELVRAVLEERPLPRGVESADEAAERFAAGIAIIAEGEFPAAVVSHGRVLAAYLSRFRGVEDAFALWRSIPFPGWTAIDLDAPRDPVPAFRA